MIDVLRRLLPPVALVVVAGLRGFAQDVSLEYRVKAAYLFNFTKFVEWPAEALPDRAPLTICVASPSPFEGALAETVRDELVGGRPLTTRVVTDPAGCHVLFVPAAASATPYLRAARGKPILTVGESADFLREGGVITFVMEDGKVRFNISPDAATRAQLRISSRLLRLARPTDTR
jgi:hypothetical protein